jgi:hypothetical protein
MIQSIEDYKYIVGVDIGSQSTSIGYLSQSNLEPTILDMSGGYKDASIPTVMQYSKPDQTWLIGDAAKSNADMEATTYIDQLLSCIEHGTSVTIDGVIFSYDQLLVEYLNQLLDYVRHINPKAVIEKVVISVNEMAYDNLVLKIDELKKHIQALGVIIIKDQLAIGRYMQYKSLLGKTSVHILDYGYSALKHYIARYEDNRLYIRHIADYEALGCYVIEQKIKELLLDIYRTQMHIEVIDEISLLHIDQMLFQYYVWFFQKMAEGKALKVFYNFAFPPFKATVDIKQMEEMMIHIMDEYSKLCNPVFESGQYFLMGNGYRMSWTKNSIEKKDAIKEYTDVIVKGAGLEGGKDLVGLANLEVSQEGITQVSYGILVKDKATRSTTTINTSSNEIINNAINTGSRDTYKELIAKGVAYQTESEPIGLIIDNQSTAGPEHLIHIVTYDDTVPDEVGGGRTTEVSIADTVATMGTVDNSGTIETVMTIDTVDTVETVDTARTMDVYKVIKTVSLDDYKEKAISRISLIMTIDEYGKVDVRTTSLPL